MPISDLNPTEPGTNAEAGQGDDELRLIKQALVDSFGGVDGLVESGAGNGAATAAALTALFDRLTALETELANAGATKVGDIKIYYGDAANIPVGWYICNGTNGTPNLQGRMLIGADTTTGVPLFNSQGLGGTAPGTAPSALGGGHTHGGGVTGGTALTMSNMPADLAANLSLVMAPNTNFSSDDHVQANIAKGAVAGNEPGNNLINVTGNNGALHNHTIGNADDHTHDITTDRDPWGAVYYVMYTGV